MSNLPAKPEFSRTASTWPEPSDERHPSGPGRASPDRYPSQRDDRDRDRDDRDRDRGNRARYAHNVHRSPPPRSRDTYYTSRDNYHERDYDVRSRDDRRKDWDRDRDRDRDMDRDRDRGYYRRQRVDDTWSRRRDYSPKRPSPSRRGYDPREGDRRGRDSYRREREWDRERGWDRDDQRHRDREHDRRPASPGYRPAPLSPRREHRSPPRRGPPSYPSRGRRSISPRSIGSKSRRSSLSRARPEPEHTHPSRSSPRPPQSSSPRRQSPSPMRHSHLASSPTRGRRSPEMGGRQPHHIDEPDRKAGSVSEPIKVEDHTVKDTAILDGKMDTKEPPSRVKDEFDSRDDEVHVKAESPSLPGSLMEYQQRSAPTVGAVASDVAVTQPYLPTIPRCEAKARFSAAYESEYSRLEAHRAHAAVEYRRSLKASRRAFHELDMTTLDLRAAQHRRELAEAHRKKAHHGQLGIDAENV